MFGWSINSGLKGKKAQGGSLCDKNRMAFLFKEEETK